MERYTIGDEWNGSRVDRFVRAVADSIPFATVQLLFRKGRIRLNGERTSGATRLKTGDTVEMEIEPAQPRSVPGPGAAEIIARYGRIGHEIEILYEDTEVLALDKPPGLVVQPGNRKERGSLLDLLEEYRMHSGGTPSGPDAFPYTPVHRLDRETSGVLLVAKRRSAARALSAAFRARSTEKMYLAVTEGLPHPEQGTIRSPLKTLKQRSSRAVPDGEGKRAVTRYRTLKRLPGGGAVVEVRIETGRTHQIRAHMASIGTPVIGDRRYGAGGSRLLLHAWKVRIAHHVTGVNIEITAPPPPGFEQE